MSKSMTVKKFIALSCEAIETLSKKDARETYKSIKNNSNKVWLKFSDASAALSLKVELNEQIEELEDEIEDSPNNKDKLVKQLNTLLSKQSTIRLIRDLEIGFNKKPNSFISITSKSKVQIHSNNNNNNNKKLISSTTNNTTHEDEDSDDDDDVFSFAAYMKLREQNLGSDENNKSISDSSDENSNENNVQEIHKQITQNIQNNIIYENKSTQKKTNKYPVDQHANYNIIAQHFKQPVTKNKNVDHSVLDFDDLQSIQLDAEDEDDYADSQMSITNSKTENIRETNVISKDNNRKWSMDDIKQQRNDTSDSESSSSSGNHKKTNGKIIRNRRNENVSDESDNESDENDFYDGESALNIKPAIVGQMSESKEDKNNNIKIIKNVKRKVNKNNSNKMIKKAKKPPKIKSKKKISGKKSVKKKGKHVIENNNNSSPKMELKMVSKFDEQWNILCDGAVNNCNWNGEDCEKLIDEGCVLKKKEIIIHSLWIIKCKEYCQKNKNKTKNIKFSVLIGYPNGQICMNAKISEVKYCIKQKIDKIILYVSCGKIIDRDWKYIKKEVSSVFKVVGKKCQLQVKYAKTNKISEKTAAMFEQTISQIIDK